jgi:hypothetical protein
MADDPESGKPSLQRSMSKRKAFAESFLSGHQILAFDQPMQIYHGAAIFVCCLISLLLALLGNNTSMLLAVVVLLGAAFFGCVLRRLRTSACARPLKAAAVVCWLR